MISEQQVTDCSTANYGCNGGWPTTAWQYIANNGGLDTEVSYPYTSGSSTKVCLLLLIF